MTHVVVIECHSQMGYAEYYDLTGDGEADRVEIYTYEDPPKLVAVITLDKFYVLGPGNDWLLFDGESIKESPYYEVCSVIEMQRLVQTAI